MGGRKPGGCLSRFGRGQVRPDTILAYFLPTRTRRPSIAVIARP